MKTELEQWNDLINSDNEQVNKMNEAEKFINGLLADADKAIKERRHSNIVNWTYTDSELTCATMKVGEYYITIKKIKDGES